MKKLSLLILLCALLAKLASATTISGTITQAHTGEPIASQKVYIRDSVYHIYLDSTLTASNGAYSFTIPATVSTSYPGNALIVYLTANACGRFEQQNIAYTGSSATLNFSICGTQKLFYGGVYASGVSGFANAKVYLIAVTAVNAATGDTTITAVDSITTSATSVPVGTFSKTYADFPVQWIPTLRVKAALSPSDPLYAAYLPTYVSGSSSELQWSNTTPTGYYSRQDVDMIPGTNPGGPSFVGGSVLLGANKNAGVGDPLSKRLLLLTKSTGEPVAYTYSDASGKFSFPAMPLGSYYIFGDALGKSNPALAITLTGSNKSINNIIFEENSKVFKGRLSNLSVGGKSAVDGISIFPNPARDFISVQGLAAIPGSKTIVLLDVTGAEVARQSIINKGETSMQLESLAAGIYLLHVQTVEGEAIFRVVK